MISAANLRALAYVDQYCKSRQGTADNVIAQLSYLSNFSKETYQRTVQAIKERAQVALHFHPDRIAQNGMTVMESLLESGQYQNQFESKCSNGHLSPEIGGSRDHWENELFGNAYKDPAVRPEERPKYGALDLMQNNCGPAARFGSCYFLLHPEVKKRCTFTYLDSHKMPASRGNADAFDDIMAALLEECFERGSALGQPTLRPDDCLEFLLKAFTNEGRTKRSSKIKHLDHYIEAQIHSPISLRKDVQMLCMDPSFSETAIFPILEELIDEYNIELFWQKGHCLNVDEIPNNFRGPEMPNLAKRVATSSDLNAADIGLACQSLKADASAWKDFGTEAEVRQKLKLLWHVLLKFGRDFPLEKDKN